MFFIFYKDNIFMSSILNLYSIFNKDNFLFIKSWYFPGTNYNFTIIPGNKDGISGSVIGGFNIGINKYINDYRKNAAIIVFEFITSKALQKKIIKNYKFLSAIPSLYDEEDICTNINCNIIKKIQFITRPTSNFTSYSEYSDTYRDIIYKYLYGNDSISNVIDNLEYLTTPYYISLNPKKNIYEFIISILISSFSIFMFLSMVFLFIKKYKPIFDFLPKDFWILYIIGTIFIMNIFYMDIGKIDIKKCQIKTILLILGINFNLIPLLYKLSINFPIKNIYSSWISRNRFIFFSLFIIFDIFIIFPFSISSYKIINLKKDGRIYKICEIERNGKFFLYIILLMKDIFILIMMILIFLEWNIKKTSNEIKFILSIITTDILCLIIAYSIVYAKLKYKHYKEYHMFISIILFILSMSNYTFLYLIKIVKLFSKNKDLINTQNSKRLTKEEENISYIFNESSYETKSEDESDDNNNNNLIIFFPGTESNAFKKMLLCHYQYKIGSNWGFENRSNNYSIFSSTQ